MAVLKIQLGTENHMETVEFELSNISAKRIYHDVINKAVKAKFYARQVAKVRAMGKKK